MWVLQLAFRAAAAVVILGGALVLLSWQLDLHALHGPADAVISALSALVFVLR